jgi:putative oxidoreductase
MLKKAQGPALLRITIGLLFLVPGLSKLMEPSGITEMLSNLGFPIPIIFAWALILVEIIFGASLLIGKNVRIAVWPLFIVLLGALLLVGLPAFDMTNNQSIMAILWHLVGLSGLLSIHSIGPGKLFSN